jgi:riboflavin kinase
MLTPNVNVPDFTFQKSIEQNFGINRGIYNIIDEWFFEQGIQDVIKRRLAIVEFSHFVVEPKVKMGPTTKARFGNGGLVKKLNDFCQIK